MIQFPVILQFLKLILQHLAASLHLLLPVEVKILDLVVLRVQGGEECHLERGQLLEQVV